MATLEAKEKDLRTIVIDGFARMDRKFDEIGLQFQNFNLRFALVNDKLDAHEEQINLLALELVNRTDHLEGRIDKLDAKIDQVEAKLDGKLDLILQALAV